MTKQEMRLYCELCAGSFASTAAHYPENYTDHGAMATICHVGNAILMQLGKWVNVPIDTMPREPEDSDV